MAPLAAISSLWVTPCGFAGLDRLVSLEPEIDHWRPAQFVGNGILANSTLEKRGLAACEAQGRPDAEIDLES